MKELITEIRWWVTEDYIPDVDYSDWEEDHKGKYWLSAPVLTTRGGKCSIVELGHFIKYQADGKTRFNPIDGTDNFCGLSKYWCYVPKLILPCNMR